MRNNLIQRFACKECGRYVEFESETMPKEFWQKVNEKNHYHTITPESPTGGCCKYSPTLVVIPCRHCIKDKTEDAQNLVKAIKKIGADNDI